MSYILDDDDRVTIARRPLKLTVTARTAAGRTLREGGVLLTAEVGGAPAPHALVARPSQMVLRAVEGTTVVRVLPGEGLPAFPEGTILDLTLRTDGTRDVDGDVVIVRDVEVSGLVVRDLLQIEQHDPNRLTVSALRVVSDEPLGPLSAAARAAARHRLGVERASEPRDLLVAVDMSASMAPRLADGTVAAVVDVVVGLSQVIGAGRGLTVSLLAEPTRRVLADVPAELAAATTREAKAAGLSCGFRSVPPGDGVNRETVVYVVTDAVPADVAALRAARGRGENLSLVLVGCGRPSRAAADVPTARLTPPPPGVSADEHLRSSPELLGDLVAAMLAAAGTADR
ncbi:MAG: hypothetical protein JNM77_10465 [Pseudonocardia sp.]|nr:hypothetical protein [Pseudonocardia sp.]